MEIKVVVPKFKETPFDIREYGAVEGGIVSCTKSIQRAIDLASENGGKVIIPNGIWLSGAITLKSNVNLFLEKGAILFFDKNPEEYPIIRTNFEGINRLRTLSPINAKDAENIGITGFGMINGNGHLWRPIKSFKLTARAYEKKVKESSYIISAGDGEIWYPSRTSYEGSLIPEVDYNDPEYLEKATPYYDFYRPVMVSFINCNNILIDGVTLENSPAWNIHPLFCTNFTLRNAIVKNPDYAQNGDGIDIESCKNVEIYNTLFEVGDDGICLKSGKNAEARKIKVPTENVYIHDCVVSHAHGGIVVGSEMSRGLSNVYVKNCTFVGTEIGIRFKSTIGRGGVVKDFYIDDIKMIDIINEAIIFTMGYRLFTMSNTFEENVAVNEEDIPEFKDIKLSNIRCNGAKIGIKIEGLDELPIHDITLENSNIVSKKAFEFSNASKINFVNVNLINQESKETYKYENEVLNSESESAF